MFSDHKVLEAFIENSRDIEIFHAIIKQLNLKTSEVVTGGIKQAIELYAEKKSPAYIVVDISKSDLAISDMTRLIEVCSPNVHILAIGSKNEVALYRDLTRIGVYDYLLTPLFPEILERTLNGMLSGQTKAEPVKSGKVIACIGSRGGVGTTFIASNLAAMLSGEKLRRIVLVDLDPYFGTISLTFNLKPTSGLREALENPGRIDQVFIDRTLTPVSEHLFILSSQEPLKETTKYKMEGLEEILKYLSKQFHYVIIDVPHFFNDLTNTILKKANILLLVTDPSVAGLRDTGRLMEFSHTRSDSHRCLLVMNKQGQYGKSELKLDEFQAVLKSQINHVIPYNNTLPMEFLNQGKMMVNEHNPLANSVRAVMYDLLGTRQPTEKVGWFKKLF